ncbi:MAG: M64 family metallopeptidase [Actinomycetota bacterium]
MSVEPFLVRPEPAIRPRLASILAVAALAATVPLGAGPVAADAPDLQIFEVFAPSGLIRQVAIPVQPEAPATRSEVAEASDGVTALHVSGPSENRFDIVIVGDGYTQGELDLFHQHAASKWDTIKATEPFATYADYFNVWTVDVVSNQSGVDNDPLPGTMKDTALDMQFWCNGTERLLCMNNTKAQQFTQLAPEADQVLGLANSTKYGGAGGVYATSSGGNAKAGQITVHELGHSIGNLADEYIYYYRAGLDEDAEDDVQIPLPYLIYVGSVQGEPGQYNITASMEAQVQSGKLKWWRWLGETSPGLGRVGTYEGGGYYRYGMYRPTDESLMRFLGRPFNLPSQEKMIQAFYAKLDPIESAPPESQPLDGASPVAIEVLQPVTHDLTIDWYLDGELVPTAHNSTTFEFPSGQHLELKVRVVDETPLVRDPGWIAEFLTQEMVWDIQP